MRIGTSASSVAILGSVLVVFALSTGFVLWLPSASPPAAQTVRVFGLVSSLGAGTHPTELVFMDAETGQVAAAAVTDGGFSIQLPNHKVYNATMGWGGNYTWQSGTVDLGQLVVDMSEGSMMAQSYNVAQPTPDSEVIVSGSMVWQAVTAQPTAIKFTASDGETFQTSVSGTNFVISLPNLMTYEVQVQATNSTGYSDWFYFHPVPVYAGISVVGITVKLGQ